MKTSSASRYLSAPGQLSDRVLAMVDARRTVILLAIVGLYLLGFNGQWRVERDSALYLTIGRNLADGLGYTYHGQPHHLAFPGLPLLFAGIFRLFHSDRVLPALVLMWLMGFAVLGLTYRLFLLHCDRATAVMMVFGLAITRLFYRYCFELLSDLPFLLGVMAFLVGYEAIFFRRKPEPGKAHARWFDWILLVAGFGVAVAMRPAMWVLLVAVVGAVFWATLGGAVRGKISLIHLLFGVAVVAAALVFYRMDPRRNGAALPQYEDNLLTGKLQHLGDVIREMFHQNIPELFNGALAKALFGCSIRYFNFVAALIVIGLCVWLLRTRVLWGLWALLTLAMLLAFKPLDRYMLPVIPLLVFAWWQCMVWLNRTLPGKWGNAVFGGLLVIGACTNLARLGEMVVEQRRVPFLAHYHEGRYVSMLAVGRLLREQTPRGAWIVVGPKVARIMTYVGRRNSVEPLVEPAPLDPSSGKVFALIGPSWDENKPRDPGAPVEVVEFWIHQRGYRLGPPVGPPIRQPSEKEPWRLYRVLPR